MYLLSNIVINVFLTRALIKLRKIGKSVSIYDSTNEIFTLSITSIFFVNFLPIPHRNGTWKIRRIANLIPIDTEPMFNRYIFSKREETRSN